jgi:hypothetical protein
MYIASQAYNCLRYKVQVNVKEMLTAFLNRLSDVPQALDERRYSPLTQVALRQTAWGGSRQKIEPSSV